MFTTDAARAFLPEQIHDLITKPVQDESVALQVAQTVQTGDVHQYRVPIVAEDPSAAWTKEGQEIDTSSAELEEVVSPFYKLASIVPISRELATDSDPAAAQLVGQGLAADIARKLDAAFFGDSVTDGPDGLESIDSNVIEVGAEFEDVDAFSEAIYAAEGVGTTLGAFVANPTDALALAKLKTATDSNLPLLGVDATEATRRLLAGVPLLVSPAVTEGVVWGIPEGRTIVAIRDNTSLDVDHSAYFSSDRVAVRATMRVAILFPHAAAVQKVQLTEE